jgi:hypothetical protein
LASRGAPLRLYPRLDLALGFGFGNNETSLRRANDIKHLAGL